MNVVVVVLSWNKHRQVIECITKLKALSGSGVDIVVVDNASSDDSVAAIRNAHPDVTLLEEPVNVGFAGGVNRGLAEAARLGAAYAWLLNDDTDFDASVIEALLTDAASRENCGLLTPLLIDRLPDGVEQFRNGFVDWDRNLMTHNVPDAVYRERLAAGATPIVPGTAMLVPLPVYRAIGPFDERFFAYWEDCDYATRAAAAGYRNGMVDAARVLHDATPTRTDRPPYHYYYMVRNEALFFQSHAGRHRGAPWKRRWVANAIEWVAENRDLGKHDNAQACIDAVWHGLTRRYGVRSDHAPAPRWLSRPILVRPWLFVSLLRGEWRAIIRRLVPLS